MIENICSTYLYKVPISIHIISGIKDDIQNISFLSNLVQRTCAELCSFVPYLADSVLLVDHWYFYIGTTLLYRYLPSRYDCF